MKINGRKTYGTAIVAIVGASVGWWTGELPHVDAIQLIVTALFAATVRHGLPPKDF
jgi:hypothetical protein